MKLADIPAKFPIPFANAAGPLYIRPIPEASQIGINPGAASLTDGFVPLNSQPVAAGGIPPFEQDMNGLMKQATAWSRWFNAGAPVKYDAALAANTDFGGYPQGAIVMSNVVLGNMFMSIADDNTADPDSSSPTNWVVAPGTLGTSALVSSMSSAVPYGFVAANGLSIGNAASNATSRANADTWPLFKFFWGFSNTLCPVFTSAGVPTTRGANAAADYAANKTIGVFNMQCAKVGGVDGMGGTPTGGYTGVPVVTGNASTVGSRIGENLHVLTNPESAAHTHVVSIGGVTSGEQVPHQHNYAGTSTTENTQHQHAYSGVTATENATHAHTYSGTSAVESQSHAHPFSATSTGQSQQHTHSYESPSIDSTSGGGDFPVGGARFVNTTAPNSVDHTHNVSGTTSSENANHTHTYSGTASTETATHGHNYSGTTGSENGVHTHDYSGTTDSENAVHYHNYTVSGSTASAGGGGAHNNVDLTIGVYWLWKL